MKLAVNNQGVSSVIAASILLAALLTIATTFQAFIVPELDREQAFIHSQKILQSFKELYVKGTTTIPLAYTGTTFFSATTYPGQISYIPSVLVDVNVDDVTILNEEEVILNESSTINMQGLSDASLLLKNVSDNIEAAIVFVNDEEQIFLKILTIKYTSNNLTLMKIQLHVTLNLKYVTHNYTIFSGDSVELPLFSPPYGLASTLRKTTQVQYTTNSPLCTLYLKYLTTTTKNVSYIAQGAIVYTPSNFPLSYTTTPWGITALQSGTSAIPSPMQIYWTAKDTLVLDLYNITWGNIGTVSGSGSVEIKFKAQNQVLINSTTSSLKLNFSYNQLNLKNSILQLKSLLQKDAPENVAFFMEEGFGRLVVTVTSTSKININILIRNVEAILK